MNISKDYRFFITLPNSSIPTQFYPSISSLSWKDSKYKEECFFRKELETELIIDDVDLFKQLYQLHKDKCKCNALPIRIDKCCCGVWTENYHEGVFAFVDGNPWNPEKCTVTFPIRDRDKYSCLLRSWDQSKNFLDIENRVDIKTIQGEIECQECTVTPAIVSETDLETVYSFPSCSFGIGFTISDISFGISLTFSNTPFDEDAVIVDLDNQQIIVPRVQIVLPPPNTGTVPLTLQISDVTINYCRQVLNTAPSNPVGWIQSGTQWFSPLPYGDTSTSNVFESTLTSKTHVYSSQRKLISLETDNGITFKDFLEFYLSDCFDCIVSNFFDINTDDTAPDNIAYQCAAADLHELIVFQSFEIVASQISENSFSVGDVEGAAGVKAFKDIWADLKGKFNLCMFYDRQAQCLRIEHKSYKRTGKILDLTSDQYKKCLIGKGNSTIDQIDIPSSETLTYKYDTLDIDFNNGIITYNPDCSNEDDQTKDVDTPIKCFLNDVANIYRRPDLEQDETVISNVTLISTTNGIINSAPGAISGDIKLNAPLASANLISKYWLWCRPQCSGMVNGTYTEFFSTIPINKQPTIEILIPCNFYNQLDPQIDKVRTQFGDCEIDSMTYNEPSRLLEVEVKF